MSLVKLLPFGRGAQSTTAHISSAYADLRTLSSTNIEHFNFAPNADISETHFIMDRHDHSDRSLGMGVIKDAHFNRTASSDNMARVLYTAGAKTLLVFGSALLSVVLDVSGSSTQEVDYCNSSVGTMTFLPGTIPSVFPSLRISSVPSPLYSCFVTNVSSTGFSLSFYNFASSQILLAGWITYLAIGVAPGIIARPQV